MALFDIIKEVFSGLAQGFGQAWWVEITTAEPRCIYYFGPFQSSTEAATACPGYIEDLKGEKAQGIEVIVKRCKQPDELTIFDEDME